MRKTLMQIVFDDLWTFQTEAGDLHVGAGYLLLPWLAYAVWSIWRTSNEDGFGGGTVVSAITLLAVPIAVVTLLPSLVPGLAAQGFPVFGYGFMLTVGALAAMTLAGRRAERVGLDRDTIWDLGVWIVGLGILGARSFYLIQYRERIFAGKQGTTEILKAAVSVWDGGLVFYGGVILGIVGFTVFCLRRKIDPLMMADIAIPSIFVGLGFGRIGCFLYGCCYGNKCALPWAVQFPPGSVPYEVLTQKGQLVAEAAATMPLHPTQIYSSINAFVIAIVLSAYFLRRPWNGAVLALGWVIYPVTRFVLEILRADEPGRFNTSLTISQWVSIGLFVSGLLFLSYKLTGKRNAGNKKSKNSGNKPLLLASAVNSETTSTAIHPSI